MIQRIQTLYLLLTVALITAMFFLPVAIIQSGASFYKLDVSGLNTMANPPELITPSWELMVIAAIIVLISFAAIFLFKKRILQIRLCIFNALLMLGFYGLVAYFTWNISKGVDLFHFSPQIALCFPLVSLILNYLAIRNIGADEALVRSLERLR